MKGPGNLFPGTLCFMLLVLLLLPPGTAAEETALSPASIVNFSKTGSDEIDFLSSPEGLSRGPLLRVVYTANTRGALYPCPS